MGHPIRLVIVRLADMEPWWERYPETLADEMAALDAIAHLGYTWQEDEEAKAHGLLVLHIELTRKSEIVRFTAQYPETFPYFPPVVVLHGQLLPRHQHPIGRNLCLIGRDGEGWRPGQDTLAALLSVKFPDIEAINSGSLSNGDIGAIEDHVGEPVSSFLQYESNSAIIVPDETPPVGIESGFLTLATEPVPPGIGQPFLRGILNAIAGPNREPLVTFDVSLPAFSQRTSGFWVRLAERPTINQQIGAWLRDQIVAKVPAFQMALRRAHRGEVLVIGFVYPDEVSWRRTVDDWFFLAVRVKKEAKHSHPPDVHTAYVRADWGGEDAWIRRAPALLPLRGKSVLLIGLGSLGSPVAIHLARAGISELALVDFDHLQVGNTVRWALGWRYAGMQKSDALRDYITRQYPFTRVTATDLRLGGLMPGEYRLIRSMIDAADLVIDASANQRVSHFLADMATECGKRFLWLTTTPGAAGGVVGRVVPGKTHGCWHCFQRGLADGTIRLPADGGTGDIQPAGCSQPTFVGAGIDSDAIALLAGRLAVATLCDADGVADFEWNVAIGDLHRSGQPVAPNWSTYPLEINSNCQHCRPV